MTDGHSDEKMVAVQGVVDRVSSYQEAAPEGTVEKELRDALSATDVQLSDGQIVALADAIEARDKSTETVDVQEVLG